MNGADAISSEIMGPGCESTPSHPSRALVEMGLDAGYTLSA
jgi:hypothetical protein